MLGVAGVLVVPDTTLALGKGDTVDSASVVVRVVEGVTCVSVAVLTGVGVGTWVGVGLGGTVVGSAVGKGAGVADGAAVGGRVGAAATGSHAASKINASASSTMPCCFFIWKSSADTGAEWAE
jgi:hypothetical protein